MVKKKRKYEEECFFAVENFYASFGTFIASFVQLVCSLDIVVLLCTGGEYFCLL